MGRTSRTTLLGFILLAGIGSAAAQFLLLRRAPPSEPLAAVWALPFWLPWAHLAFDVVFLWLAARRFHDQDRPGWLALVPTGIAAAAALGLRLPGALALLIVLALLVALFLPGTIGPNRYGPDPRGWKSRDHYLEERRTGRAT
jgi:uncharacterized membrane protein YhaH (DUF805 family)